MQYMLRGIRGATTLKENTESEIKLATIELLGEMIKQNEINIKDIDFVVFSLTDDINKAYPAKFARENFDFKHVPMMCFNELKIENSLKMCLRIMINLNTTKEQNEIKHIYLKEAKILRKDLEEN